MRDIPIALSVCVLLAVLFTVFAMVIGGSLESILGGTLSILILLCFFVLSLRERY